MRTLLGILAVLFGAAVSTAEAQQRWDVSGSVGWFEGRPESQRSAYGGDWYGAGRYAAQIGHYWTEHLKTEVEFARSGEVSTFHTEFRNVPGSSTPYPYSVQSFHRLDQLSARMVWQFGHNAWVHPYVSGGIVGDRNREHYYSPLQYQYSSGRANEPPAVILPAVTSDPISRYRFAVTAAAGAKVYMSPRAFFNTGIVGSWSQPAQTVSVFAGFGLDF